MSVYVIDYENTSVAGLTGIEKLLDTDVVVVFFSTNAPKIDIKAVEKIQKSNAKTVFKEANVKITGTDIGATEDTASNKFRKSARATIRRKSKRLKTALLK